MPSNLSEAEWRAQGWLAKPTKTQQIVPSRGCCTDCATMIIRSNWKPGLRISAMFGAIIAFLALAYWLMTIFLP